MQDLMRSCLQLADNLTSKITQLTIDIPHEIIDISSLLDASYQHYNVHFDPLDHVFHHALDHIVDLVDVLGLSLRSRLVRETVVGLIP